MAGLDPAIQRAADGFMHIAVIDIGSPKKGSLGWAIRGPAVCDEGMDLDDCIDAVVLASKSGPVAFGFEAPMFVPLRQQPSMLTNARAGEGNKAFSGAIGATVLVTGLAVIPYALDRLRQGAPYLNPTFAWRAELTENSLLLFEAFVSNQKDKSERPHIDDAILAIKVFNERRAETSQFASSIDEPHCLNLLGAMLLRTGWTQDISVLSEPCLGDKV